MFFPIFTNFEGLYHPNQNDLINAAKLKFSKAITKQASRGDTMDEDCYYKYSGLKHMKTILSAGFDC